MKPIPVGIAVGTGVAVGYLGQRDPALSLLLEVSALTSPILLDHVGVHRDIAQPLQIAGAALLGDRIGRDIL